MPLITPVQSATSADALSAPSPLKRSRAFLDSLQTALWSRLLFGLILVAISSALIFPNLRNVRSWADKQGFDGEMDEAFFARPEVVDLLRDEVKQQNEKLGAGYLRVKAFAVLPHELSLEKGELTPSMKVVRWTRPSAISALPRFPAPA